MTVQTEVKLPVPGEMASSKADGAPEEMLDSKGPFILDVMVPYQEHVLPMIPSGMTVKDIIKT